MEHYTKANNSKIYLEEVSLIRIILIVLLVLYHSFAPWCDAWRSFDGFEPNIAYWWIGKMAYSFMLPMFVFISGYVWAFQRETLNKKDSLKKLVFKKFKRLYIPSFLFSIAYLYIFDTDKLIGGGGNELIDNCIDVFEGYAHMWFLPMLFWTFLITWSILKLEIRWLRWGIIILMSVLFIIPFPMGIGRSLYYIIYFYAGYEALAYKERISNILQKNTLALVLVVFIITFVFLTDLEKEIPNFYVGQNILVKTIWFSISNVLTKIYGFLGILSLYCFCVYYTNKNTLNPHIKKLDKYCFGVYLFQQFFLQAFYYHSLLPNIIESYLLPWICFTVALVISVLLSIFVKHQKIIGKLI